MAKAMEILRRAQTKPPNLHWKLDCHISWLHSSHCQSQSCIHRHTEGATRTKRSALQTALSSQIPDLTWWWRQGVSWPQKDHGVCSEDSYPIYGVWCLNVSLPVVMATVRLRNFIGDTLLIPLIKIQMIYRQTVCFCSHLFSLASSISDLK